MADAISYIRTTADGRPAVLINLTRQPSANTVAIAAGVRRLFAERPELLPKDVRWTTFYDQAEFVSHSVNGVRDAILIGVGLAGLVLLVFLRSVRIALVAVATIPLTVAVVLLALGITGQTINLMTLGGIAAALGLIADDAIVVAESIQRHREEGSTAPTITGLRAILRPLIGSSLSTIVIFLPFALLTGVAGAFFQPLALTMALALAISFFVSALGVPVVLRVTGGASARPAVRSAPPRAVALPRLARRPGRARLHRADRRKHPALPAPRLRLSPGDGRGLDHPRLLDSPGHVADRHGRHAERAREGPPDDPRRPRLLAPHRHAARLLHHGAEPRRLRHPPEAPAGAARRRGRDRGHPRRAPPRSPRPSTRISGSCSRTTSAT